MFVNILLQKTETKNVTNLQIIRYQCFLTDNFEINLLTNIV